MGGSGRENDSQRVRSLTRTPIGVEVRRGHGHSSCQILEAHLSFTAAGNRTNSMGSRPFSCWFASTAGTFCCRGLPWSAAVDVVVLPPSLSAEKLMAMPLGMSTLKVRFPKYHKMISSISLQKGRSLHMSLARPRISVLYDRYSSHNETRGLSQATKVAPR